MWDFSDCNKLQLIAKEIYENDGLIAAICHGPRNIANLKLSDGKFLVSGKKISCFTDDEEKHLKLENEVPFLLESKMKSLGATLPKQINFSRIGEVDGRIITAQNPPSSIDFGEAIIHSINKL